MAVHTIETRSHSELCTSCLNEFQNDFGHMVLFPAFMEEYRTNEASSAADLLKSCLRKTGVCFDGSEALQLHTCLFHQAFTIPPKRFEKGKVSTNLKSSEKAIKRFSSHDYFIIILDKELDWFNFYKQILPYVRLQLAVEVVSSLEEFCSKRTKVISDFPTSYVMLLTSALEMLLIVTFDMLQTGINVASEPDEILDESSKGKRCPSDFHILCEYLSHKVLSCSVILLQLLDEESVSHNVECDMTTLLYIVEMFSLTLLVLTPFCDIDKIKMHFKQVWIGRVNLSNVLEEEQMKKIKRSSEVKRIAQQVLLKQLDLSNLSGKEGEKVDENSVEVKESFTKANNQDETNVRGNEKENCDRNVSNISLDVCCSVSDFLLFSLRQAIPLKFFFNIVQYFSRGEDDIHIYFYNNLSCIIENENHTRVGDHHICRKTLFFLVEELLGAVTRKTLGVSDAVIEIKLEDFLNLSDELKVYPDRKLFCKTQAEEVLAQRRQLSEEIDLVLVKQAVEERMTGWHELVSIGMQNSDFENWWNKGFYDLVLKEEEYLSSEDNVRQVLFILNSLLKQQPVCWEHSEKTAKLFKLMFCRLPAYLQERIVLYWTSSGENDQLPSMKGKEEVLKETTTLLNRLTSETVHQLSSEILVLCLYAKDTVLTQALHVAIGNKGQVEPVIQLLRQMPGMCTMQVPVSGRSFLMRCLEKVLSSTHFDERSEDNFVKMLNLLLQGFHQLLDADSKTTHWNCDGVLSVEEVLSIILLPVFDAKMIPDQNETNGEVLLPLITCLKCLSCIIQTVPTDKLHCLNGVVLVEALTNLCIQTWPSVIERGCSTEEEEALQLVTWQNARMCFSCLIERLINDEMLDSSYIHWVLKTSRKLGLLALAMVYPLVLHHSNCQMIPILELVVEKLACKSDTGTLILSTLIQLGVLNNAMCNDITQVLDADITLASTVSRRNLAPVMSQILSQSLASDMIRTCKMLRCILPQFDMMKGDWQEVGEGLINPIKWEKLATDCQLRCLCILSLTDGLIWLLTVIDSVTTTQKVTAVSNYQTAYQEMLQSENLSPVSDQEELLVFMFFQCCAVLSFPQCSDHATQGLHVLAMTVLTNLHTLANAGRSDRETGQKSDKTVKRQDSSCQDGDFHTTDDVNGGFCVEWKKEECFLYLRDVVCCIRDDLIRSHLIKQLKEVWTAVSS